MDDIIKLSENIINELNTGFNEVIYQNALKLELRLMGIHYETEVIIPILYKGFTIGHGRADIIIKNNKNYPDIIIELKSINTLNGKETQQLSNYLRYTGIKDGILINFNQKTREVEYEIITNC